MLRLVLRVQVEYSLSCKSVANLLVDLFMANGVTCGNERTVD